MNRGRGPRVGGSDVLDRVTVLPSRKIKWILVICRGLGASPASLFCSGNQKGPSSSPATWHCTALVSDCAVSTAQRLEIHYEVTVQNLVICICVRWLWGFLRVGGEKNCHPSKIPIMKKNRTECKEKTGGSFYEKRNRRTVNKAHLFQINMY